MIERLEYDGGTPCRIAPHNRVLFFDEGVEYLPLSLMAHCYVSKHARGNSLQPSIGFLPWLVSNGRKILYLPLS